MRGPAVVLPPATAQTIALAIARARHQRGEIRRPVERHRPCQLGWRLSDGPARIVMAGVRRPHKLSRQAAAVMAAARSSPASSDNSAAIVKFDWQVNGLCCTLSVPHDPNKESLRRIPIDLSQTEGAQRKTPIRTTNVSCCRRRAAGLEDARRYARRLRAQGRRSYNRFSDAMLAAKSNNLQAGILDVNLGGEKTYAVADILANRKIPFAFVTGYGPDTIVSEFSHAPVLQKPIEAAKLHALLQQIVR